MSRDPFDAWLADARAGAERMAARAPHRDFADAVARAHELAPARVPADLVEEAESRADVVTLHRGTAAEENALDALVRDARAGVAAQIEARRLRPTPPLRVGEAPSRYRRTVAWVAAGLAAAGLLAALGLQRAPTSGEREAVPHPEQAVHGEGKSEYGGEARARVRPRPQLGGGVASRASEPGSPPEDAATVDPQPPTPPATGSRSDRRSRLRELSRRAEAKWKAGDLVGAQALYERVVASGGRSREAELAYADLFAIAHRRRDHDGRRELWRRYLRRFPEGRFVDDARAGLCRAASDASSVECWRRYRTERPHGAYRAEADRALGGSGP